MKERYHRLWVCLREQLTDQENGKDGEIYSSKSDVLHEVLTLMTKMEAAQFLEDGTMVKAKDLKVGQVVRLECGDA